MQISPVSGPVRYCPLCCLWRFACFGRAADVPNCADGFAAGGPAALERCSFGSLCYHGSLCLSSGLSERPHPVQHLLSPDHAMWRRLAVVITDILSFGSYTFSGSLLHVTMQISSETPKSFDGILAEDGSFTSPQVLSGLPFQNYVLSAAARGSLDADCANRDMFP